MIILNYFIKNDLISQSVCLHQRGYDLIKKKSYKFCVANKILDAELFRNFCRLYQRLKLTSGLKGWLRYQLIHILFWMISDFLNYMKY